MRISTRKGDPGFHEEAHLFKVFLNGKELIFCFTADEETGEAFIYEHDEDYLLSIDRSGTESKIKEQKLTGLVAIKRPCEE